MYCARACPQQQPQKKPTPHRGRRADADRIRIQGVDDALLQEAAHKTEGFSGRELAKLMASAQAAAYGSTDGVLTGEMFTRVRVYEMGFVCGTSHTDTLCNTPSQRLWTPRYESISSGVRLRRVCTPVREGHGHTTFFQRDPLCEEANRVLAARNRHVVVFSLMFSSITKHKQNSWQYNQCTHNTTANTAAFRTTTAPSRIADHTRSIQRTHCHSNRCALACTHTHSMGGFCGGA